MRLNCAATALAVIVLAGALARFDGISFGLPNRYHPDESGAADALAACAQDRRVERRYRYPPLLVNLACRVDPLLRPLTARVENWRPHYVFTLRFVSAAAGTAAIAFVYLLALRFVAAAGAAGAALLFAVFPAAIAASKYGTPDSLLTMFVVMALWLQVRIGERGNSADYFVAALATTLAVAAKYNGAVLALSLLAAHVSAARTNGRPLLSPGPVVATIAAVMLGAAIGFPDVLFGGEAATLASGLLGEQAHLMASGHYGFSLGAREGGFVFHFVYSILPAAGPLLLAIVIAGLIAMLLSRSAASRIVLAFALPYYAIIEWIYKVPPSYERYVLPLLCVYVIAVAVLLERLVATGGARRPDRTAARSVVLSALWLAALWFPLTRSAAVLAAINDDTRTRMGSWLTDHDASLQLRRDLFVQWPTSIAYYPQIRGAQWFKSVSAQGPPFRQTAYVLASSLFYERYLTFPHEDPEWTDFYRRLFAEGELVHEEDAGAGRYMFHNPTLRLYRIDPPVTRGASPPPASSAGPGAPQRGASTTVGQRSPDS